MFHLAGSGRITAPSLPLNTNLPRLRNRCVDKKTVLMALSAHLDGNLNINGFPDIPNEETGNDTHQYNSTLLLLRETGESHTRMLDIVLMRGDFHLSISDIELPVDGNLLFRAVATASKIERDGGFTQIANNDAVKALHQKISKQLIEQAGRTFTPDDYAAITSEADMPYQSPEIPQHQIVQVHSLSSSHIPIKQSIAYKIDGATSSAKCSQNELITALVQRNQLLSAYNATLSRRNDVMARAQKGLSLSRRTTNIATQRFQTWPESFRQPPWMSNKNFIQYIKRNILLGLAYVTPSSQPGAASDTTVIKSTAVQACLDAMSAHLDSPLAIDGLPGFQRTSLEVNPSTLTHLIFYQKDKLPRVMIHLIRNSSELFIPEIHLPRDSHILFRAVATAHSAARNGNGKTPAASDAEVLALRQSIEHKLPGETDLPLRRWQNQELGGCGIKRPYFAEQDKDESKDKHKITAAILAGMSQHPDNVNADPVLP